jgi:6-pyruvoyltetrahydropterin/6-carboxytetrahydropterin synthase
MGYRSIKRYGHDLGLSACFRQHRATSHCSKLHGYALAFRFVFECDERDERGWVMDFGGLKALKSQLEMTFDHSLMVAADDPMKDELCQLSGIGLADVIVVPEVGCEAFAKLAFDIAVGVLDLNYPMEVHGARRLRVISCECAEHGANSAIYYEE